MEQLYTFTDRTSNTRNQLYQKRSMTGCIISPILFNLYSEYMMKDALEEAEGLIVNGQNFNNLRYADDAAFLDDKRTQLQRIIDKVVRICNEYQWRSQGGGDTGAYPPSS